MEVSPAFRKEAEASAAVAAEAITHWHENAKNAMRKKHNIQPNVP
jgi:hypothetical protein